MRASRAETQRPSWPSRQLSDVSDSASPARTPASGLPDRRTSHRVRDPGCCRRAKNNDHHHRHSRGFCHRCRGDSPSLPRTRASGPRDRRTNRRVRDHGCCRRARNNGRRHHRRDFCHNRHRCDPDVPSLPRKRVSGLPDRRTNHRVRDPGCCRRAKNNDHHHRHRRGISRTRHRHPDAPSLPRKRASGLRNRQTNRRARDPGCCRRAKNNDRHHLRGASIRVCCPRS